MSGESHHDVAPGVDPHQDWDAAYVLGALTPQQRHVYEDHLAGCAECRQAVAELAAMPGLLAQLPPAEAMALNDEHRLTEQGDAQMPESLASMRPPRTGHRTMIVLILVTMLSLVIGGVIGYLIHDAMPSEPPTREPDSAVRVAFDPVNASRMIAVADVAPDGAGTWIGVHCQYSSRGGSYDAHRYLLYVIDERGERVQSKSWWAAPGKPSSPELRSRLPMEDIDALEIVLADSDLLLMRAAVP